MNSYIDTELLIIEVEARKNLWHAGDENYKDRDIRLKSWQDVTKNLIENYESMNEMDKKTAVEKVQQRWKSARDAKMRSMANKKKLKSGSASKKFKEYVYDKQLQFIESVSEPNRTESNIDDDASQGQDQCIENEEEIDIESTNYEDTNEPWKRKRGTKQGKKKMDEFEEEFLAALRKTADEDEDKCFLDSLLPTLRLFDNDQKLNFRSRVLATMIEIKTTRTIPTLPSTSTSNNYLNYPHYPPHQGLQGNFPIMPSQPGVDSYKVPDTSDNNWYTRTNE